LQAGPRKILTLAQRTPKWQAARPFRQQKGPLHWAAALQEGRVFILKKKKQKDFNRLRRGQTLRKRMKVSWFSFPKKDRLPSYIPPG
jgi:hypothetical protein